MLDNLPSYIKDKKLASLMTELEVEFRIPALRNPKWERENEDVIALYTKISFSRSFNEPI